MLDQFLSTVYSEELFDFTEEEYAAVMADAISNDYEGYAEWSAELEQGQIIDTPRGQILINRDCSHAACRSTRCERDVRVGGIAV